MLAIKSLNAAINFSARRDGDHRPGLPEALILLSEAYSKLGAKKEMIHSAKLAVTYAHKRLTVNSSNPGSDIITQIETTVSAISHVEERDKNCYPLLHTFPSLLASYYNLAVVLESSGPAAQSIAMDWYLRVISAATSMEGAETRVRAESAEVTQWHNSDDVIAQIHELKQFASNAISRLEQSPTLLTIDTAFYDSSAASMSQDAQQLMRSEEHVHRIGGIRSVQDLGQMKGELAGTALMGEYGQRDSRSPLILARASSSSSISRLHTHSYDSYGTRREELYIAVNTGESGGKNCSGQPSAIQGRVSPRANDVPSPRPLEIEVDSRKQLPLPVSRSRPQSAYPRLLSDVAVTKPFRLTPSVTPSSGPRSSSESTRTGPRSSDSVRGVGLLSTPAPALRVDSNLSQRQRQEAVSWQRRREDSLQRPSSYSAADSGFFSEAEYEQQQYDLTMAALSSRDHFLFLPASAEETLSSDNINISSHSNSNSDCNAISTLERSSSHDRGRVHSSAYSMAAARARDTATKMAHITPPSSSGRSVADQRKSNKGSHQEPRRLSRTQSALSYVGMKTSAMPLHDRRRKSDAFMAPEMGIAVAVTKQQHGVSSHKKEAVEEKQGKATKLRQETLAVRSRAALTMQRVARGFLSRSSSRTLARLEGKGDGDGDGVLNDPTETSTALACDGGEESRMSRTSVGGLGTGSTKDAARSRRGSTDSSASKEVRSVFSSKGTFVGVLRGGKGPTDSLTPTATPRRSSLTLKVDREDSGSSATIGSGGSIAMREYKNHGAELKLSLCVGSKIEGRYMAMRLGKKSSWLPGKVSKVHANGSFNLLYNNGTKEFGVRAEHIRVKAPEAAIATGTVTVAASVVIGMNRSVLGSDSPTDCMQQHILDISRGVQRQENSAVLLQKIARGYLERKRHKGLLLQIKRCMDLRMREKEVTMREARVWDRFEGIVVKAREEVARSLQSLNMPEQIKSVAVVSRKNSNTTPATEGTGSSLCPSTLESSSPSRITSLAHGIHEPRMEPHLTSALDMDESLLFSISDSDEQVVTPPLEKPLISAIDEMEMETEGGESGEECGEVTGVRNEIGEMHG